MQNNYFPDWMGEFPRKQTKWPQSEIDELYYGFAAGLTIKQIAAKHGRTCGSIISKASETISILRIHFSRGVAIRIDVSFGFLFPSNHRDGCDCSCGKPDVPQSRSVTPKQVVSYKDLSICVSVVFSIAAFVISIVAIMP